MTRFSQRFRLTGGTEANSVNKWFGGGFAAPTAYFDSIASASGTGSSLTMTFSSIPTTYSHLQLRIYTLATTNTGTGGYIRFNSDTGSNYAYHWMIGYGTSSQAAGPFTQTEMQVLINNSLGMDSVYPTAAVIDILDYTSTSKYKTLRCLEGVMNNSAGDIALTSGLWQSATAINAITFYLGSGAFATTTKVALYGVRTA
jgi:hypothetical protein